MGRNRKPFIDKKQATTYNLLYRANEIGMDGEAAGPERELVDASRRVGIGCVDESAIAAAASRSGSRYPSGHPLAWLQEPPSDNVSEKRREELIQLGFPDDGYDYLKHLREPGRGGKASLEAGPSVFLPSTTQNSKLEDDQKIFDASRLTLHQAADDEDSAVQAAGGVTAFSRQRERLRQAEAAEVAAMEALLGELQDEDDEEGDLEDDFIVAATQAADDELEQPQLDEAASPGAMLASARARFEDSDTDAASDLSSQSDWEVEEGAGASQMDARPGSIASTYWRPERSDRKNLLTVVDERFEHLALDYDEDDIGSLASDDPEAVGEASLDDFGSVMDDFLAKNETSMPIEGEDRRIHGVAYVSATDIAKQGRGPEAEAAAKTVETAKRLMQEQAEPSSAAERRQHTEYTERPEVIRERWDCESVLSLRSNLDNHPASISEPQSSRRPRSQLLGAHLHAADGFIPLGRKTGIPVPASYGGRSRGAASDHQPSPIQEDDEHSLSGSEDSSFIPAARRKGETAEEKKARKAAVKEAKRAARVAKKDLKGVYKQEMARQVKAMVTPAPATISLP